MVVNDRGEWLMIHRNGRWDSAERPSGGGERIEECAAREVEEETGGAGRSRPLCETCCTPIIFPETGAGVEVTHWYELHTPVCRTDAPDRGRDRRRGLENAGGGCKTGG